MEKKQIGWFCTYTPLELIEAAGFLPYGIREDSGYGHEDVFLGDSICSYVRSCVGGALYGSYDFLSGVVIAHSCECMRRLYDAWRFKQKEIGTQCLYFLDVPRTYNARSVGYFAGQLQRLKEALETVSGPISDESLWQTIRRYEHTRELFDRILDLRKQDSPRISGSEAAVLIHESQTLPRSDFNKRLEAFIESKEDAPGNPGPRIMICGGPESGNVVNTIERAGGVVVYEDTCNGMRSCDRSIDFDKEPLTALSERYLGKNPCPRMLGAHAEEGLRSMRMLAKTYRADGIIYYAVKFCANMQSEAAIITNEIDLGVPFKLVEGDLNDDIDERVIRSFIKKLSFKRCA
jgi:benzoyl-CoA reductase/2-hydroxyglutaryl-CoA dehydratase subunit BcrC/BadD/HgdB